MINLSKWREIDFQHFIVDNHIDEIFVNQCNHPEGIKCVAIVPNYPSQFNTGQHRLRIKHNIPNTNDKCDGWMTLPSPSEAAHLYTCQKCGRQKRRMFRWQSPSPSSGKLFFETVEDVRAMAKMARTYYSTLGVWDEKILDSKAVYDDKYLKGYTLGIDLDLIDGTLFDYKNKVAMNEVINIIRDELSTLVPNSYNLQTSGNGVYILIHHALLTTDYYGAMFAWSLFLDEIIDKVDKRSASARVVIQVGNDFARVFKMIGSIHLVLPTVAVPLPHNVDLTKFNMRETEIENVNTDHWEDIFYNRCDKTESISLQKRLKEICEKSENEAIEDRQKDRNGILLDTDLDVEKDSNKFRKKAKIATKHRGKKLCAGVTHHKDYSPYDRLYVIKDNYRVQGMEEDKLKETLKQLGLDNNDFLGQNAKR